MTMKPLKPYLLRAYYDWIVASNHTPYLLIQADLPHVNVPPQYIDKDDHSIVLDIAPIATNHFVIGAYSIDFQARFDGVAWNVCVPYYAILGLYAQENEEGIMFERNQKEMEDAEKEFDAYLCSQKNAAGKKTTAPHPHLRVIVNEPSQEEQ